MNQSGGAQKLPKCIHFVKKHWMYVQNREVKLLKKEIEEMHTQALGIPNPAMNSSRIVHKKSESVKTMFKEVEKVLTHVGDQSKEMYSSTDWVADPTVDRAVDLAAELAADLAVRQGQRIRRGKRHPRIRLHQSITHVLTSKSVERQMRA